MQRTLPHTRYEHRSLAIIGLIIAVLILCAQHAKATGTLDPAFGIGGKVITDFGAGEHAKTLLLQPDGKIVVTGLRGDGCVIARYNSDGGLDSRFGHGGKTTTQVPDYPFATEGAALQPDGKIVVVGSSFRLFFPPHQIILIRYNTNGTLDTSFGENGIAIIFIPRICDGLSVIVQPDGKIIAGGGTKDPYPDNAGVLIRLNEDGSLDNTFGIQGVAIENTLPVIALRLQSNGKIIGGLGMIENLFGVLRYNGNGSRDLSFAGEVYAPFDVRADDKIVGRVLLTAWPWRYRVQRFSNDGSVDSSFINKREDFFVPRAIAVGGDGKAYEVGSYYDGTYFSFAIAYFTNTGLMAGFSRDVFSRSPSRATDVVVQPDGKILVLGDAQDPANVTHQDLVLLRFLNITSAATKPADFDGDSRTDIAVYRAGSTPTDPSHWHVLRSSDGSHKSVQFGSGDDRIVPADFDGDGSTDFSVWRPSTGVWYTSLNPATNFGAVQWGISGDIPVPGDFDGDGTADHVVFRPSNGFWYVLKSSDGGFEQRQFGSSTDKPLLGDFDGDGKSDFAYLRTTGPNYNWHILQSSNNVEVIESFGVEGDRAVAADYDGDGKTNIAVYRPGTGKWYTSTNVSINFGEQQWGTIGDVPAPGDFDADGKTDLAVFRPSTATWHILKSGSGSITTQLWGIGADVPVSSTFIAQ